MSLNNDPLSVAWMLSRHVIHHVPTAVSNPITGTSSPPAESSAFAGA